ncbi:hypothetical protein DB347_17700 [Opitutaceae bacterium EW11]|nr:hypothetical protein DB347_17700 [Opitutaceae bacterium EW11]
MPKTEFAKEIEAARTKLEKLEAKRTAELATLPSRYGYESISQLIEALKAIETPKAERASTKAPSKAAPAAKSAKRGKRAKITQETKDQVKAMVEAEKTGAEIAKELGISLPSVHNIKKELGLTKPRK